MRAFWVVAVSSTLVGCTNPSSNSESSGEPSAAVVRGHGATDPPLVDPAPVRDVDRRLAPGFELRRPVKDGRMTLIPIVATIDTPAQQYLTLHAGMRRGLVSVRELGGDDDWEVDTVRVTNGSQEPLAIIEGELLEDAYQDRVTAENVVIQPGKTQSVSVRCVEEDRSDGDTEFHAGDALAELGLRRTVVYSTQDDVWKKVKAINAREKLRPPTNTYRLAAHAQTTGDGGARRDALIKQLEAREERPHIVGLVVAIDDKLVAVDWLATPELYRDLEAELIASYLPATAGSAPARTAGSKLQPADVRMLLDSTPGSSSTAARIVIRNL